MHSANSRLLETLACACERGEWEWRRGTSHDWWIEMTYLAPILRRCQQTGSRLQPLCAVFFLSFLPRPQGNSPLQFKGVSDPPFPDSCCSPSFPARLRHTIVSAHRCRSVENFSPIFTEARPSLLLPCPFPFSSIRKAGFLTTSSYRRPSLLFRPSIPPL